mmetsp:Transcript_17018/g.39281  ORF Transcript_17018/g.39281 Transcript_17018/m.39281 type:complete len:159 (-) Transcript_17018:122-598(-)
MVRNIIHRIVTWTEKKKRTRLITLHASSLAQNRCSACRTMEPLIEKFQKGKMKQLYKDRVKFVTVDVEEDPSDPNSASSASFSSSSSSVNHEIVSAWKVESLPSFCLWKQGRMVERLSGANPFRLFLAIHQHAGNNATSEDPTAASGAPLTGSTNFSY